MVTEFCASMGIPPLAIANQYQDQQTNEVKRARFFPSDAFVASARSFNMFKSMLQLELID